MTEPAKYPGHSNYHASKHNEHDVCFTFPDMETDPSRSVISMDQQLIVMYLSLKGLNTVEIHNVLVAIRKGETKFYSILMCNFHKPSFSRPKTPQPSESPAPILNESDEAVSLALSGEPFASVRQLTRRTHLHLSTVCDYFMHKFGFTVRHLLWVPHLLSELTNTPEHKFHLNSSRCSSTRKTGHGMTL
jgi:hypothetical protein